MPNTNDPLDPNLPLDPPVDPTDPTEPVDPPEEETPTEGDPVEDEEDDVEIPPEKPIVPVDREALLDEAMFWLPNGNAVPREVMASILERLIRTIGDDVENEPEILCKFLAAIANVNVGRMAVDNAGVVKEKVGSHETTYAEAIDYGKAWQDFKDSLPDICPLFGYSPSMGVGGGSVRIHVGARYNPLEGHNSKTRW